MDASSGGRKEGRAADTRRRTRRAEEADKVVLIPGITVRNLISYRAALIGSSQEFLKRRLLCWKRRPRTLVDAKMKFEMAFLLQLVSLSVFHHHIQHIRHPPCVIANPACCGQGNREIE